MAEIVKPKNPVTGVEQHYITSPNAVIDSEGNNLNQMLDKKANKDGFYGSMGVGGALNLIGHGSVPAQFTRRPSGGTASIGTGYAEITKLKGKTIVWNQLVKNGNFTSSAGWSASKSSISINNGVITAICSGQNDWGFNHFSSTDVLLPIIDHKYLFMLDIYLETSGDVRFNYGNNSITKLCQSGWNKSAYFIYPSTDYGNYFEIRKLYGSEGETLQANNFGCYDLTKIFGAGNEPSTPEEFEAMFPLPYYEYNTGELISFNGTGIKTDGFNQYNPTTGKARCFGGKQYQISGTYTSVSYLDLNGEAETLSIDSNGLFTPTNDGELTVVGGNGIDTCVHLTHSGYRNGEYEPHWEETHNLPSLSAFDVTYQDKDGVSHVASGMKSAGSVSDELTATHAVRRIGVVDLGTLDWTRVPESSSFPNGYFFAPDLIGEIAEKESASYIPNIITSSMTITATNYHNLQSVNMGIYVIWSESSQHGRVWVVDNTGTYTTAVAFKAAMSGVLLYYELAEPVVTPITTPQSMNYRVDDFGTETLMPENTSEPTTAPFNGDIRYNMNAVDVVRKVNTLTEEEWEFELEGGSTVTKKVALWPSQV